MALGMKISGGRWRFLGWYKVRVHKMKVKVLRVLQLDLGFLGF